MIVPFFSKLFRETIQLLKTRMLMTGEDRSRVAVVVEEETGIVIARIIEDRSRAKARIETIDLQEDKMQEEGGRDCPLRRRIG